ncbi:MotA/TolQ/ExbB proton channel family protein [candidate division KSB1 bacterium]|nr:MotA/TolQ/ExbB proton channel family protein [candidate division KSB1 bacterium]NIR68871.1 MotA/TolQ/ExbB proton channel family protein [candidate division KSB1 bacterium]NIS27239.1 MotA/TolQ/ExbB proton channel family protein [candidate division KSB1 bacterium]NIT74124.1 MotA/TolQ/ExbB proton channel family protein [candidate division KSB1 bacterium]NIU27973.1 MotA/TolQ/ExbB proton channel family protein [candidate division KSB1 bacterium]
MNVKYISRIGFFWGLPLIVLLLLFTGVKAQSRYELSIDDIAYLEVHKNWLFIPTEVDLRLKWSVEVREVVNDRERVVTKEAKDLPFTYQIYMYEGDAASEPAIKEVKGVGFADFPKRKMGKKLVFKIRAYSENSTLVAESAPAEILIGKNISGAGASERNLSYFLHPGRWQLAVIGKAEIYDNSTTLGKVAFLFLSVSTFLSIGILLFYSTRTLYLGNIFPYKRAKGNWLWSCALSCDNSYQKRLTNKFKFVLQAWETIATNSRKVADRAAKSIPNGLSSTEKLATVDVACMEYWTSDGDKAIGTIEDIIAFPDEGRLNGRKNPDDLLTELVIKIEDSFQGLISKSGQADLNNSNVEDMEKLIDEIYEPVINDDKFSAKLRKWVLRKGVFDQKKGLEPFPTSKIIRAGLEIHRMNGYRWLKPSEEVKRAFENRASIEIEHLRRKSRIEWFWNYGALAPLVGLFGTVTGITYAFQQLSRSGAVPNVLMTIQELSNGIFEALWTTIFGLANGIVFLLIYYYFKHKLDWIYAKWEDIYTTITEKL